MIPLQGYFSQREIEFLYELSSSQGAEDISVDSYQSLKEQLGNKVAQKMISLSKFVADQLTQIDRPSQLANGKNLFDGFAINLSQIIVRNENGFQVRHRKGGDEGHVHSIGWVTGTLALKGLGSWHEVNGVRYQSQTEDLLLFTNKPRAQSYLNSAMGIRHGTPSLVKGVPRLLVLFEFEFAGANAFGTPKQYRALPLK